MEKRTSKGVIDIREYICDVCYTPIVGYRKYYYHMGTHSENKCKICNQTFKNREGLESHTKRHEEGPMQTCNQCGKAFYNHLKYIQHIKGHERTQCVICKKMITNFNYAKHKITHLPAEERQQYTCATCGRTLKNRSTYRHHIQTHVRYDCDICGRSCSSKSVLKKHRKTHMSKEERQKEECVCWICGKVFICKNSLWGHLNRHKEIKKVFKCSICQKEYRSMLSLKRHNQNHPSLCDGKDYSCCFCKKKFKNLRDLKRHRKRHTKIQIAGKDPLKCIKCGDVFHDRYLLDLHTALLCKKKTFGACPDCGDIFYNQAGFYYHLEVCKEKNNLQSEPAQTIPEPRKCESCGVEYHDPCLFEIHENLICAKTHTLCLVKH